MNSEEAFGLVRKGTEPYASRYGYAATKVQLKKKKREKYASCTKRLSDYAEPSC